jgi:Trypsin
VTTRSASHSQRGAIARGVIAALTASIVVSLAATSTRAVVVRHDRTDENIVQIARGFKAVGEVVGFGACTLIAPRWVITAAHVAGAVPPDSGRVRLEGREYAIDRIVLHPESEGWREQPPEVDLALIHLAAVVDSIEPLGLYSELNEKGKIAYIVGYGDAGTPREDLRPSDGKRRAVTNAINDVGPVRLFMLFDEPPLCTELEGIGGPGDSGGPALLRKELKMYVAGVSSAGSGPRGAYGSTDIYMRVSTHRAWIDSVMAAARW